MKIIKIVVAMLCTGIFFQQLALSQTNADAAGMVNPTNPPAMAGDSNQPVAMSVAGSNTTESAADASPATANETDVDTNVPAALPPIVFQDVPLTTAIEALAREANINYLMDPKIGYGQPDQNGQIKPEPTVSVRWENVTFEQALVALLDNYGLQIVEDSKTKISKITTKDPTAPPPLITRVIQLKYASTSNMLDAVTSSLTDKRSRIVPDVRTSQLVIVATDPEQAAIDILVNELDKPTRQVLIETRLVELSSNPTTQKGVDWSSTLQAQNIYAGNYSTFITQPTPPTTTTTSGGAVVSTPGSPGLVSGLVNQTPNIIGASSVKGFFQNPWFLNADGLHAVLSFLNSSSDAQVVSTPRIVTLDNETATISITRGFPVINVQAGTANTAGGSDITYSNIGTVLAVTPRITANDYIWLKVIPDVSSFFGTVTKSVGGVTFQADEFDSRHIETQVLIPNAHTLVMGGLVKDNPNAQYTKVPILGDIPVLGLAFRSENKSMEKDNLLIFITPTIVKDSDFKPMETDFLNSQQRTMPDPMNPHNWWDSAEPRGNWSNPITPTVDKGQAQEDNPASAP